MLRKFSRMSNYSTGEDDETSGFSDLSYSSNIQDHGSSGRGKSKKKWSTAFRVMQGLHRFKNFKNIEDNVSY
uniref:Ovule protein n=1 Tax=Strongyloides papillosus TaxID=174720 RepID=A0A0N5B957_STREA